MAWFAENAPSASSELDYDSPYQLLVAVMLSAQCTDRRVNMVTPALFEKYPSPQSLAAAEVSDVYALVKSVSYPNSKAAHLVAAAGMLCGEFGGEVPSSVEELMRLPGVGRKTANVIASVVFGEPVIAVDTHVFRVSHRIGLSSGKTPEAVEKDLEEHIPPRMRPLAHHQILLHGRYVCTSRKPHCSECGLADACEYYSGL